MRLHTAISLFSGCGGDTLGMEMAGIQVKAFTEIDKTIQKTHLLNFPDTVLIGDGDMIKIPDEMFTPWLGCIDIIFAGFPCQGFSNAGKKKMNDSRNSLFEQFVRCVRLIHPKVIIGENVTGILTRKTEDGHPYIDMIRKSFDEIGYTIAWQTYDCTPFIPQSRSRFIMVGVPTADIDINPLYLLPNAVSSSHTQTSLESILTYSSEGEIPLEEGDVASHTPIPSEAYVYESTCTTTTTTTINPHPYLLKKKQARGESYNNKTYQEGLLSFGKRISPIHAEIVDKRRPSKTIICTYENQPRLFVPQQKWNGVRTIRCFTIQELKQIQGFPMDFQLVGTRKQQIHMIGNAVPPPLIYWITKHICQVLQTRPHPCSMLSVDEIFHHLFSQFQSRMTMTCQIVPRSSGNTQAVEKNYSDIFASVLNDMNLRYTKAGSQQPIDYTIHHPVLSQEKLLIELKRTSTNKIMCNDTLPTPDVYYIIIHESKGIRWCKGDDLLQSIDQNQHQQFREALNHLRCKHQKNGNVTSYARPNYAVCINHLFS